MTNKHNHKHEDCHTHIWAYCSHCQVYYCTVPGCDAERKYLPYQPYTPYKPYRPWQPAQPYVAPYNPWQQPWVTWEDNNTSNDPSPRITCGGHING